jgi:two-component system cell cycle sensor histidine kinase/response regulator CckA
VVYSLGLCWDWNAISDDQGQSTTGDEFGAEQWTWTVHPDDLEQIQQELWRTIQERHGFNTEFRILEGDEVRWLAIKSSLFCDDQGNPERLLGIQMDITDKKQMEEQFFRAQRLESLGTLASGIAHDLNNILTPILLVVQLLPLKLPDADASVQAKLDILEHSAQRGADLVKQILSFARGVEGKRFHLQVHHLMREINNWCARPCLDPSKLASACPTACGLFGEMPPSCIRYL